MKEELLFRRYVETDDRDLSKLVNKIFGTNFDDQLLKWKYRKNPAGPPLSAVAEVNGRIVAHMGAIPVRFFVQGSEFIGSLDGDFLVDKNYRKFDTLYWLWQLRVEMSLQERIAFCYGFPNLVMSKIAQRRLRAIKVASVPRLVKILDIEPFLRRRLPVRGLSKLLSAPLNSALRILYSPQREIPGGTQLEKIKHFDERFDSFWNRIKGDYPIMTVKDSAYLNWRYLDIPHKEFEIISLKKVQTGEILGFTVLGETHSDVRVGQIIELVTPKNDNGEALRSLLALAISHFYQKKKALVTCWMFSHCHSFPELIKRGFKRRETRTGGLFFRNWNLEDPAIQPEIAMKKENWYICMGNSD